jgi:hypothetical protein
MGCASAVAASAKQLEARSGELQCLPNCKSFELLKRKALRARKRKTPQNCFGVEVVFDIRRVGPTGTIDCDMWRSFSRCSSA